MHRNRQTKIVATLGPSSSSENMILWLFERGVDVFRLNFSHGNHETHAQNIEWIHKLRQSVNRPIAILADLQGPKLRVGQVESSSASINAGQTFIFDMKVTLGDSTRVQLPHPEIFEAAKKGDELLVDDGKLAFRVDFVDKECIKTTALVSGTISNNKGLNLPSTHLPIDILTEKDRADLEFALSKDVDFVGLSFVQTAEDILQAKKRIHTKAKIIAKLEKPQAIQNLTQILKVADGVMIARGDLGVELPLEQVPSLQRHILREAHKYSTPVIVATQMLESMIQSPKPTRAEVSDVATAVYLGTDAVMLSAESASGAYPKEAVEIMDRVVFNAEQDMFKRDPIHLSNAPSIAEAAVVLAHQHKARIIAALSNSFEAVAGVSSLKPGIPILVITSDISVYHQLILLYGVHGVYVSTLPDSSNPIAYNKLVQDIATKEGVITRSDHAIVVMSSESVDTPIFSGLAILK